VAVTPLHPTAGPASSSEPLLRMDAASARGRQLRGVAWFVGLTVALPVIAIPLGVAPAALPFVLALMTARWRL
jgi:hypothetical protein